MSDYVDLDSEITGSGGDDFLNSVFSTVNTGLTTLGSYFNSLNRGTSSSTASGSGSGQASTTTSNDFLTNLFSGAQSALMQIPAVQQMVNQGIESTAQQKAGAFITNPITWVVAGGVVLFLLLRRR